MNTYPSSSFLGFKSLVVIPRKIRPNVALAATILFDNNEKIHKPI